jgi:hypothetical protein
MWKHSARGNGEDDDAPPLISIRRDSCLRTLLTSTENDYTSSTRRRSHKQRKGKQFPGSECSRPLCEDRRVSAPIMGDKREKFPNTPTPFQRQSV